MAPLTFEVSERPDALVVAIGGDADVKSSSTLENHLTRFLARQPNFAVIDLSGLAFISSLTLGMLVHAHRSVHRRNGRLLLAAPQPQVMEVIRRCHLEDVLNVYPTVDEALAAHG